MAAGLKRGGKKRAGAGNADAAELDRVRHEIAETDNRLWHAARDNQLREATELARARRWQEMLDTGEVQSLTALAEKMDVDRSYVSRVLQLMLLATDIVEAILTGREPSGPPRACRTGLSLAKLTQTLPVLWDEQRKLFGFPPG